MRLACAGVAGVTDMSQVSAPAALAYCSCHALKSLPSDIAATTLPPADAIWLLGFVKAPPLRVQSGC